MVQVYHWNETDVEHYLDYIDTTEVELDEKFIDFNFHTPSSSRKQRTRKKLLKMGNRFNKKHG